MTPKLPQRSGQVRRPGGNTGFWFGLGAILFCVVGFMALLTAILPDAIFLFLVLFGFVGIVILHYLTWGRWLSRIVAQEPTTEDETSWPEPPLPPEDGNA